MNLEGSNWQSCPKGATPSNVSTVGHWSIVIPHWSSSCAALRCAAKASCLTGASCWALSQPCNIRTQILLFTTPKQYVLYIYIASIKAIQTSQHRVSSLLFLWVWTPFQKVSLCGACPEMTCASTCSCYWCIYRWVTLYLKDGVLAINMQLIYVCISAQ